MCQRLADSWVVRGHRYSPCCYPYRVQRLLPARAAELRELHQFVAYHGGSLCLVGESVLRRQSRHVHRAVPSQLVPNIHSQFDSASSTLFCVDCHDQFDGHGNRELLVHTAASVFVRVM